MEDRPLSPVRDSLFIIIKADTTACSDHITVFISRPRSFCSVSHSSAWCSRATCSWQLCFRSAIFSIYWIFVRYFEQWQYLFLSSRKAWPATFLSNFISAYCLHFIIAYSVEYICSDTPCKEFVSSLDVGLMGCNALWTCGDVSEERFRETKKQ